MFHPSDSQFYIYLRFILKVHIQNVCIRHFNALHQLADDEVVILHGVILQSFDDVRHLGAHVGIRLQYSIAFLPFFQFVLDCI